VPFAAGGPTDVGWRVSLAPRLGAALGRTVVVENKVGATGGIGAAYVAKSQADGSTLLLGTSSIMAASPNLTANRPVRPGERLCADLAHRDDRGTSSWSTRAFPAKNVAELVAYAKANPGKLTYATSGIGSTYHLGAELFASETGIKMTHVPYKGAAPAIQDVLAGHVSLMFDNMSSAIPNIRARARCARSASRACQRYPGLKDVYTIARAGSPRLPDDDLARAPSPRAARRPRHSSPCRKRSPMPWDRAKYRKQLEAIDMEPHASTPGELADYLKADLAKWAKVVKESGHQARVTPLDVPQGGKAVKPTRIAAAVALSLSAFAIAQVGFPPAAQGETRRRRDRHARAPGARRLRSRPDRHRARHRRAPQGHARPGPQEPRRDHGRPCRDRDGRRARHRDLGRHRAQQLRGRHQSSRRRVDASHVGQPRQDRMAADLRFRQARQDARGQEQVGPRRRARRQGHAEMDEVLKIIARENLVLATGHVHAEEVVAVTKRAKELGVKNILVTHGLTNIPGLSMAQAKEVAAMGAMIEICYLQFMTGKDAQYAWMKHWDQVGTDKVLEALKAWAPIARALHRPRPAGNDDAARRRRERDRRAARGRRLAGRHRQDDEAQPGEAAGPRAELNNKLGSESK
jgi:tripartite-type tricarboxylate transporter receptor subunit TctC